MIKQHKLVLGRKRFIAKPINDACWIGVYGSRVGSN